MYFIYKAVKGIKPPRLETMYSNEANGVIIPYETDEKNQEKQTFRAVETKQKGDEEGE